MNFFRSIFGCSPSKIAQSQSPKQDAKPDAQEQMGGWKIFINIDQRYMMTAIPLLLQILHGPEAPRCMFKFSTSAGASQVCGIGKSVELIFSRDAEEEARRSPENCGVKKTLEAIGLAFYEALHNVIRPECGSLPQAGNVGCLVASKECKNLEKGRFVRKIPITHGVLRTCNLPYFTYRHEKWEGGPVLPPEEAEALRKRAENWRAEGLHCPRVDLREDPYKDIRLQWHDRFNR